MTPAAAPGDPAGDPVDLLLAAVAKVGTRLDEALAEVREGCPKAHYAVLAGRIQDAAAVFDEASRVRLPLIQALWRAAKEDDDDAPVPAAPATVSPLMRRVPRQRG